MVAADGHRVGHVGDVALEATVDVEPAALGAGGLVSVVRPRLRLQERDQRHLPLNLLGVRAAVIGDEELVVAEEAGLDASGADHGHQDPEEVGGIDEKTREVLGEQETRARAAAGRHVLVEPLEVEERVWDPLSEAGLGVVRIGVREQHRRMTEAAVGDHAGGAAGGHVGLRADQAERHGVILMALRNRPVHAVAEVHLPPPCLAELPDRVEAGSLRLVRRFLGPGLVERLQPVVAPHRSCEVEAGFDFELASIDGPAGGDQRLGAFGFVVRGHRGWSVGGGGRLPAHGSLRAEPRGQADLRVGPQSCHGPVGERLQPHEIERALVQGEGLGGGIGERGDPVKADGTLVSPKRRGDLVGDRLEAVEPQELAVLGQRLRRLRRERRDAVETQQAVVSAKRRGRPLGELLEPGEFEEAAVPGEQFDLAVRDRGQARQPQVTGVTAQDLRHLVADGRQAQQREGSRGGGGDEGAGGVERQFGETVEFKEGVGLRQGGGRLRRERRKAVEHDRVAGTAKHFGDPRRQHMEVVEFQVALRADQFGRLLDRKLRDRRRDYLRSTRRSDTERHREHHGTDDATKTK